MVCSFNILYLLFPPMAGSSMARTGSSMQEERDVKGVYIDDTFAILFNTLCVVDLHFLVLINYNTEIL